MLKICVIFSANHKQSSRIRQFIDDLCKKSRMFKRHDRPGCNVSLVSDIVIVLSEYLRRHKYHSLHTLAQKSGIGYSTIRRLAQGEAGKPNADTVINLIDAALTPEERIVFLKKHFPKISNILEDIYHSPHQNHQNETENIFLKKSLHSFIFNMAATTHGTTVSAIKRLKGEHGLRALEELLAHEVLYRDQKDRIRYRSDGWNTGNADIILDQIRFGTEFFDKSLLGTDAARMAHVTGSVNMRGLRKIHALCTQFFCDLVKIQKAEENQGKIPFFTDLMMNIYDSQNVPNPQPLSKEDA